MAAASPDEAAFRELRLLALRVVTATVVIFSLGRHIFAADNGTLVSAGRLSMVAHALFVLVNANEDTAQRHGVLVTLVFKMVSVVRALAAADNHAVATLVLHGAHRVLPLFAVIMGGARFSAFIAVWACAETSVALLWGPAPPSPEDALLLGVEIYYIAFAAILACSLERNYRRALASLANALTAQQRFITNMNHEIRTPLVGILGMTDLVLGEQGLSRVLRQQLLVVHGSARALLAIVNNILDASKLGAQMLRLELQSTDVRTVASEVVETFQAIAVSKGLAVRLWLDPSLPTAVTSDAARLQQIMACLIDNACKFTDRGGVAVAVGYARAGCEPSDLLHPTTAEHRPALHTTDAVVAMATFLATADTPPRPLARLRLTWPWRTLPAVAARYPSARSPHGMLWIRVADTGVGMSRAQLGRAILPFQQADDSTTRRFGGTGLGLSIARNLVRLLGGDLLVASTEGVGSIFVVVLPCAVVTDAITPPRSPPRSPALAPPAALATLLTSSVAAARPRVVIADDNPLNVQVLRRQLARLGCDSVAVEDGAACVAVVEHHLRVPASENGPHIDAILMDLHMPVLDGLDAARAIRRLESAHGAVTIPIVTVSADDRLTQYVRCREAGMAEYLQKPVVLKDLRAVLERVLPGRISADGL